MSQIAFKSPTRNKVIAKIHIAKSKLALDQGTYRAILRRVVGKDSCSDMTEKELLKVVDEFKRLGFKENYTPKRAGKKPMADDPQSSKIRALWMDLYHIGEIEDPSEAKLTAFCKRMAKVNAMQWMTYAQANKVINALRGWLQRKGVKLPSDKSRNSLVNIRFQKIKEEREDISSSLDYTGLLWKLYIINHQCQILKIENIARAVEERGFGKYESIVLVDFDEADPIIEKFGAEIRSMNK